MRKPVVFLAVAAAAVSGLAVMGPTIAGAIDSPTTTAATAPPATAPPKGAAPADRAQRLRDTLKPLVDKGTITQAQADAVVNALTAAAPQGRTGRGMRGFGRGMGVGGAKLDTAAKALGMTLDELRTALRNGQTLAQVAQSKGVPVQKVTDALVAEIKSSLDAAVTAGRLTRAQADQMLTTAKDRVTQMVNGQAPQAKAPGVGGAMPNRFMDGRRGGHRGFPHGGPGMPGGTGGPQPAPAGYRVARV